MSTHRSVGRSAATHENVRSAATHQNGRFAATHQNSRSTATRNNGRAAAANPSSRPSATPPSTSPSPCLFTFSDGRRCRTPRSGSHPHFCFYHARKESQAQVAQKLGNDFHYLFSAEYVSACDLTSALGRLLPAVARGDIKPRTASTLAYLAQTLVQALHLAQHEYINAFGTDGWRRTVRNSVNQNFNYGKPAPPDNRAQTPAHPPAAIQPQARPQPPSPPHSPSTSTAASAPAAPAAPSGAPFAAAVPAVAAASSTTEDCHPERSEGSCLSRSASIPNELESPSTPAPSTDPSATPPADPPESASPTEETPAQAAALAIARSLFPRRHANPSTPSANSSNYGNSFRTNIYDPSRSC